MSAGGAARPAPAGRFRQLSPGEWLLIGITLGGALLRFGTIAKQSFWLDEAFTYGIVSDGLHHVFTGVSQTESTPPLYYVLAWIWSRPFGLTEAGLRSFSAVCGTLAIPVMWALGRRLVSEPAGLIAAALTAVNPLLLWYSQEARSYMLLVLLSAGSLLALVWALERPVRGRLVTWGVVAALAVCTHYFAAFLLVGEIVWLVLGLRRFPRGDRANAGWALGPVVAMALLLTPLLIHQWRHPHPVAHPALIRQLDQAAHQAFGGYGGGPDKSQAMVLISLGALGLALLRGLSARERTAARFALATGGIAILLAVALGLTVKNYVVARNLLELWPALFLLVAIGLGSARSRWPALPCLAAILWLSLSAWAVLQEQPYLQRADWRGIVDALGPPAVARALVSYPNAELSLMPYASVALFPQIGVPVQEIDVLSPAGAWLGWTLAPLALMPPPPGFTLAAVDRTNTYLVVRYRAAHPIIERSAELQSLYPGLPVARAFLQLPRGQPPGAGATTSIQSRLRPHSDRA